MNARSQVFEIAVEARQVEEAVASLFHAILFHRSMGKYTYSNKDQYVIGDVGYEDVDCDFIDHTYIRTKSHDLKNALHRDIKNYSNGLKFGKGIVAEPSNLRNQRVYFSVGTKEIKSTGYGHISLEFYQKRHRWPAFLGLENIPWEIWTIRTDIVHFTRENCRRRWQEKVGEILCEKIQYVAEVINRHNYVPEEPKKDDLGLVFHTTYPDVQPYLFNISFVTSKSSSPTFGDIVQRFMKNTLSI